MRQLASRSLGWVAHPWVRRGITIALTVLSIGALGGLIYSNWDTLRDFEWQIRPVPLLVTAPAYGLALGLAILAWGKMMDALNVSVPWHTHIRVYSITNLARRLPGMLWYVAGRVILYDESKDGKVAISVGSALELVLIALSGLVVGAATWPGAVTGLLNPFWIAGAIALSLTVLHPRVIRAPLRWLGTEKENLPGSALRYSQVLGWLCIYAGVWVAGGIVLFALIEAVYPMPFTYLPQVIGAWSLSGMVSVIAAFLPVSLGLRELALGLLLAALLPEGIAIMIALLARVLLTLYELVVVAVVLLKKGPNGASSPPLIPK